MSGASITIHRAEWEGLVRAFEEFFSPLGEVGVTDDAVMFSAPAAGTGLTLSRDGSSSSFMPLHGLEARWDTVAFQLERHEVTLSGDGVSYVYRVPPSVIRGAT